MSKIIDITGQVFGRLTVIKQIGFNKDRRALWLCKCSCGNETTVTGKALRAGTTRSCGCLIVRNGVEKTKHGMTDTKEWNVWRGMMKRCYQPTQDKYPLYGGKGIIVCERWHTFQNFYEDMGNVPEGMTIDRIDSSKNYEPENCRWVDIYVQNNNRGDYNVRWSYKGKDQTVSEWARELGCNNTTLFERQRRGWSIEKILSTPTKRKKSA
ncbi:hypothetical protein H6G33_09305 [Calothrix sp. FACHB-1219]|uniref:hypothetical protein n=1 Tax=unclassified Calothrix TaxID=2619626 RepID=UPI001688A2E7|nr:MULTISPECIES: hypothetical protein [unclassified Calothrix]MBD2201542.1 hypothetical protein [Calothrix sp. FACHB-168]MBD2217228.1 hypothetical protein [Calothrix sp. FACHB-1219]